MGQETIITFWCRWCRLDWKLLARKIYKNRELGEVWSAKCAECGTEMVRLINDAHNDPYFRVSRERQTDLRRFADDLLQQDDPRFDILYPQHKKEREEREAKTEKEAWEKKKLEG